MKFIATILAGGAAVMAVLASPITERSNVPGVRTVDDSDKSITYQGTWSHLTNQGSKYGSGTLSYTGQANAQLVVPTAMRANTYYTLNVYSSMKNDRGNFNAYLNSDFIGTGDEYTSANTESNSKLVLQVNGHTNVANPTIHLKNDKGAPFFAFDYLELSYVQ